MKAKPKIGRQKKEGNSKSAKANTDKPKPGRTKRVRPLVPRQLFDIIERINDGLVVLDKDWYYVYVNQKAAVMLQRQNPSELIGKHIWTEYPDGMGQPFQIAYEKAMRDQTPIVFEDHYEPWDLWFENRIYPSPDSLLILFTEITDRKRIERLLNERQYFLQKILDTEPGTVYIYDLDERRNIYINRYWLLTYGYTEEETQAMGDELLIRISHPDDMASISTHHENWKQAGEGDIREFEFRVRTKSGDWRWLHGHEAAFARDETGRVKQILGIMYEITERKLAQEALRHSEQQLGLIYDSVSDIIFLLSIEPDDRYCFVSVNKMFLQATGLRNDQAIGKYADEIIPPSSHQLVFGNYKKAIQEASPVTWEEVSEYPAGKRTAIVTVNAVYDEAHICTHLVGIIHDITERKRTEQALQESEEKFSKVFHASPIPLSISRMSDERYIEVNESFLKRLGYQREEVIGRTAQEIGIWANPAERQKMLRTLNEQGSLRNFEGDFRTKSGEIGTALLFRDVIELAGTKHLIGTSLDITERKEMEKAALKERDFSDAMLNSLPGIFYFYDQAGKFLRWNRNFEIVGGYSGEEIARMNPLDFFMGEEKKYIAQRIQDVFENGESDAEANLVSKNGNLIPYYFTGRRIEIENVPYLIGMGIDITDRKQAEEKLRLNEARYRAVVEHQTEFIVRWKPDGLRTFVNEAYRRYFGLTPEQALSAGFMPLVVEEDRASLQAKLSRLTSGEVQAEIDTHRVIKPDGSIGWQEWIDQAIYDEADQIVEFQSVGRDVTERKRTEEALAASEAELRVLFAAMNDVVLVLDRNGIYRKIAPTNPNLLSKPPEELLGKSLRDTFAEAEADAFISTIREVIETQEIARIEYELVINEKVLWFEASISPMEADKILWMARDITDRKQAEERLRQLNEELEQRVAARTEELAAAMIKAQESDRLKSAFLAAMSHELRTPLNSIIGFTGVILQGLAGPLNEEQTKQLNMTRDSARHLLALINDVLDISKIEAGQLEILKRAFDMRQAVESALRVIHPLAQRKSLQLVTSIGTGVGMINNDRRRVEQVLINLVNNAIKFSERGQVRIECRVRGNWLETSVHDHGIGIKSEDMYLLFKPFQQIDTGLSRGHEGTGLGLAICERLVTAMGGTIRVESQWDIGSTFTFTLPI